MKLSFQPSNELRANTEPRVRPETSQVNQRAEPRFEPSGTQAKLSRSPNLNHTYRARSVLRSRLSQDEPSRHRSNPRAGPSPNKLKQNPEPRAEPRAEAELSLESRPSLASSQAPSPEESLRLSRAVKHRIDPGAEMPIRASNKAEPSTEPRTWFEPV